MGSINRRIHALEGRGDSCATCGWGPHMTFEVEWDHDLDNEDEEPEYCPACGRPVVIVITWGDEHEA